MMAIYRKNLTKKSIMLTENLNRIPPHILEYEQAIVASCFFDAKNLPDIIDALRPEHFYKSAHQIIFGAIQDIFKSGEAVELPSVVLKLKEAGKLEQVGGASYVASLLNNPISTNAESCCRKIKEKAALRQLIEKARTIERLALEDSGNTEEIINQAQIEIISVEIDSKVEAATLRELTEISGDRYEKLYKNKGQVSGIRTGFSTLDMITSGFQKSDLIVIAGRPSMGKTSLAVNMTSFIGKSGVPTGWFSLEMSRNQITDKIVAGESGINSSRFRDGAFSETDWEKIGITQNKMYGWPIFIDDSEGLSVMELRRRTRRMVKKFGCKIFFIDYLHLIRGDDKRSRDLEVGTITKGLKGMAKELDVPVVLLSQLNRQLEQRNNKRPQMSDLRDSGSIEQDADLILFLYRRDVYDDWFGFKYFDTTYKAKPDLIDESLEDAFSQDTELNIAKHRSGATGMTRLMWQKKQTRFYDVARIG